MERVQPLFAMCVMCAFELILPHQSIYCAIFGGYGDNKKSALALSRHLGIHKSRSLYNQYRYSKVELNPYCVSGLSH